MKSSRKEIEAILKLTGPQRFERFVKVVADRQEVWGLFNDGWALAVSDDETSIFPIWPSPEYAEVCATDQWAAYVPKSIKLDEFIDVLLPRLEGDGVLPGVFYTPSDKGVIPEITTLKSAIENELKNY